MKTVIDLLPYIVGGYETLVRIFPTKGKNFSLIHKGLKALVFISQFLNREKPFKKSDRGLPFLFMSILISSFLFIQSCKTLEKFECLETTNVDVTIVDNKGREYFVVLPVCNKIKIKTDTLTSTNLKLTGNE